MLENRMVMETFARSAVTTWQCARCESELEERYLETPSGDMICLDCVEEFTVADLLEVFQCKSTTELVARYYGLNDGFPSEWED
jgi:recombinational DNA repair protein (RecF pathway)